MNVHNKTPILLLIIVLSNTILACGVFENEIPVSVMSQFYMIEPNTILDSIVQEKNGVFTSTDEPTKYFPVPLYEPVTWGQNDFFQIAEALHEHVWGENLDTWKLYYMDFGLSCDEVDDGLQHGQILYFSEQQNDGKKWRITHSINIDPRYNIANVWETEYDPMLVTIGASF